MNLKASFDLCFETFEKLNPNFSEAFMSRELETIEVPPEKDFYLKFQTHFYFRLYFLPILQAFFTIYGWYASSSLQKFGQSVRLNIFVC